MLSGNVGSASEGVVAQGVHECSWRVQVVVFGREIVSFASFCTVARSAVAAGATHLPHATIRGVPAAVRVLARAEKALLMRCELLEFRLAQERPQIRVDLLRPNARQAQRQRRVGGVGGVSLSWCRYKKCVDVNL